MNAKIACLLLATVALGQRYADVPYVPTPQAVVDTMLEMARLHKGDVLVDLGSGDGRIVITAAKRYGIEAVGVEIDPDLVRQSRENARKTGVADRVNFVEGDLFDYDLRKASVVAIYLFPDVNLRLKPKLLRELRPGARVVSHRFDMGLSWKPDQTADVEDGHVYLWTIPEVSQR